LPVKRQQQQAHARPQKREDWAGNGNGGGVLRGGSPDLPRGMTPDFASRVQFAGPFHTLQIKRGSFDLQEAARWDSQPSVFLWLYAAAVNTTGEN
jgi:hypothetical protein